MSSHINTDIQCLCCLLRPADNDLNEPYTFQEKTEVYLDMIKQSFKINIILETDAYQGICLICIDRLCDAVDFKQQIVRCQNQLRRTVIITDAKEELTDLDDLNEQGATVDILNLENVKVNRRSERKKNVKKRFQRINEVKESTRLEISNDQGVVPDDISIADRIKVKRQSDKKRKTSRRLNKNIEHKKRRNSSDKLLKKAITKINGATHKNNDNAVSENAKYKLNIQNILKYSNCTPFSNKAIAGISCMFCKGSFNNIQLLSKHYNDDHQRALDENKRYDRENLSIKMDITDLRCSICDINLNMLAELKEHLIVAHSIQFYPDLNDYFLEFKLTDSETFNCVLCYSTFETFKMLLQHMNGHYRNFICDICDMGFINKHRLKNHKRTHEMGTFKCSYCGKVFSTKVRLMCHMKYTHERNARYTTNCPHCEKSFTSYYQRNRHMILEHNSSAATYKCNICDKSFIMKSKLTYHIKKIHLLERNHMCNVCGQEFFIKQSLDEHMVKHNGEKTFKCTVCLKAYARKKTLTEHMRIHNNDRRFKCGVCGITFIQKCSMKNHMLSNHGITLAEFERGKDPVGWPIGC